MVKDYKRSITHKNYKNPEKLKRYYHRVEKKIYVKPGYSIDSSTYRFINYIMNDDFVCYPTKGLSAPLIYLIVSLVLLLGVVWFILRDGINNEYLFFLVLSSTLSIFFLAYLFTKPKKEKILNRRDNLFTMPGFYWQKNITMPFDKVEFAYSTGGEDGMGAFLLEAIRPNKWQTFVPFGYSGKECYESMSFITWYMDKNRPLPPGTAFDPYREQDFERRKAEGFPKPLYPSKIQTPEATKEQQAERKRIGGW